MNPWGVLEIAETGDERAIKRAYAKKLKFTRPEDDAEGFQLLHDAYQAALQLAPANAATDQTAEPDSTATPRSINSEPADLAAFGMAVLHDAWWQPCATLPDAGDTARALWNDFLAHVHVAPLQQLKRLADSDAMLDLEVREHIELSAVQFSASDQCSDEQRAAIASHFGWGNDSSFVQRHLPDATDLTLARLRAQHSYQLFKAEASSNRAIGELLADQPGPARMLLWDRSFVEEMRGVLQALYWHHREMLAFKLTAEVVTTWEDRIRGRRYFLQTALWSTFSGLLLWCAAYVGLRGFGYSVPHAGILLLLAQAAAFAGGALLAFQREHPLATAWATKWAAWTTSEHDDWRHKPIVQTGWVILLATVPLLLLPRTDTPILLLTAALLIGTALLATWANSLVLPTSSFVVAALCGLFNAKSQAPFAFVLVFCVTFTLLQLLQRGGQDALETMGVPFERVPAARLAWLSGTLLFIGGAATSALSQDALLAMGWIWLIGGALLSRMSIGPLPSLAAFLLTPMALISIAPTPSLLQNRTVLIIATVMLVIAVSMIVNMKRAREHQHLFA